MKRFIKRYGKEVYGEFEDTGAYIKCKNCGFICKNERDHLYDYSPINVGLGTPYTDNSYLYQEENLPAYVNLEAEDGVVVLDAVDRYERITTTANCPFCGSYYK